MFIEYERKRLLRLDYVGLSPEAVIAYMEQAKPVIATEPPRSVRLLSVVGIHMTEEIAAALKRFAMHNRPFVLASAIVGATPFQKSAIGLAITAQGRKNVEMFDDEQQAKDWLVAQ